MDLTKYRLMAETVRNVKPAYEYGFGGLLHDHRKRRRMTLVRLARECDLDAGNLSRIERGERRAPKGSALIRIMEVLHIRDSDRERFVQAAARNVYYAAWQQLEVACQH